MTTPTPVRLETLLAHRAWVRRVALALVRDERLADDLEQDLWVKVLEKPPTIRGSVRGWLAATLRNDFLNRMRGDARRSRRDHEAARREAGPDVADLVADAEALRRVVDAVLKLAEPYRATMLLRYYEDLSPADIAARQGVPLETVRTRLKRAVEQIRAALGSDGDDRKALGLLLAPLLRPSKAAVVGGALVAKKMLAAAVVALVLWLLWYSPWSGERAPRPAETAAAARQGTEAAPERSRAQPVAAAVPELPEDPSQPQVEVTVLVVGPDDAPLPGAVVGVFRANRGMDTDNSSRRRGLLAMFEERTAERSATTGAKGTAAFRLPSREGWAFSASKDGFARGTSTTPGGWGAGLDLSRSGGRADVVLRLERPCVLTGRVLDEDARPVAGAIVSVTPGVTYEYDGVSSARATCGEDGRYTVLALRPGTVRVQAAREGQAAVDAAATLPYAADFDLVVRTPGHVVGRVLDADGGAPIAGAVARASTSLFGGTVEATSAADGSFRLAWCLDEPLGRIVAECDGWSPAPWETPLPEGAVRAERIEHNAREGRTVIAVPVPARADVRQDVLMMRAGKIRGIVRGPDGPLPGARVVAITGREPDAVWVLPVVADAQGRYALGPIRAGPVVLHAALDGWYAPGFPSGKWDEVLRPGGPASSWRVDMPAGADLQHDIVLARGVAIDGVVVTAADSAPVAGAEVRSLQKEYGWRRGLATSRADGSFRLEGLVPDTRAFVWGISPDWCMDDDALDVDPAAAGRVTLRMAPPVPVRGTVLDADGAPPPAGTTVTVMLDLARTDRAYLPVPQPAQSAAVAPDGRFELLMRAPSRASIGVGASAPGRAFTGEGPFPQDELRAGRLVHLRLPAAEVVRGRVVVRGTGAPVPGATIRTWTAVSAPAARTGPEGTFVLEGRQPGESVGQGRKLFVTATGFALGRAVAPPGGGDVVVVEMEPVFEIAGTLRFEDGTAAAGVIVGAERDASIGGFWYEYGEPGIGPFRAETTVDAAGAFRIQGVAAGRYVLLARAPAAGKLRMRPARSAPVEAGARDVAIVVARRTGTDAAAPFEELSDGDLGIDARARYHDADTFGAVAAWEALLARPITDDARAEAIHEFADGPLRGLGRRDEAIRLLQDAAKLAGAGELRRARVNLALAGFLSDLQRWPDALAAARAAAEGSRADEIVHTLARFRAAEAQARLGDTAAAREELLRLRELCAGRAGAVWPQIRSNVERELGR